MSGSSGSGSTTTTKADPWGGVIPYLAGNGIPNIDGHEGLYQQAAQWMRSGGGVAAPDQNTLDAENQAIAFANNNDSTSLTRNTVSYLSGLLNTDPRQSGAYYDDLAGSDPTANGSMLNGNPYLSQMVDAASRDVTRNFTNSVMPGLNSTFSAAGRFGSGAQLAATSDANNNLSGRLGDIATNIYGTNYANERQLQVARQDLYSRAKLNDFTINKANQFTAASALPGLESSLNNAVLNNANILSGVGAARTGRAQSQLDNQLSKLISYSQILSGTAGLGGQSTQTQSGSSGPSQSSKALSGAAGGAAIGTSIMPGWGTAIGAGVGLLGGLLA